MFCSGFSESTYKKRIWSSFPHEEKPYTDHYDYESDSDLEDDLEDDELELATGIGHARIGSPTLDAPDLIPGTVEGLLIACIDLTCPYHLDDSDGSDSSSSDGEMECLLRADALCREIVVKDAAYDT